MDQYYETNDVVNDYTILKMIGKGRYGIVYLAENERKEKCVVKQLKLDMLVKTRKKLFYEEQILQQLKSSYFPQFISRFKEDNREGYLMEYIEGKVFEDILFRDKYVFDKEEIYKVGSQLIELIDCLHKNQIVHRDIRLPNVIRKENKELALIDFGLARYIDGKKYRKDMDYWFLGDFLLFLYYSSFEKKENIPEKPWFEELDLIEEEIVLLKKLLGIEEKYHSIEEIKEQFEKIKEVYHDKGSR